MRCSACNSRLTEYEATRRYASNGQFVDLCSCSDLFLRDVALITREDLRHDTTDDNESETENQDD